MNKKNKNVLLLGLVMMAVFAIGKLALAAGYQYVPLESIPGAGTPTNFQAYVLGVYNFLLWAVGISALLMISIGGFMYFTAAGNTSKLEKAKSVISDALIGIVAVMTTYLLLFVINPDLVNINLSSLNVFGGVQNMQDGDFEPLDGVESAPTGNRGFGDFCGAYDAGMCVESTAGFCPSGWSSVWGGESCQSGLRCCKQ